MASTLAAADIHWVYSNYYAFAAVTAGGAIISWGDSSSGADMTKTVNVYAIAIYGYNLYSLVSILKQTCCG